MRVEETQDCSQDMGLLSWRGHITPWLSINVVECDETLKKTFGAQPLGQVQFS